MELLYSLTNSNSVDHVVNIINRDATEYDECYTSDYLAGQYAFESALDSGFFDEDSLESHLDFISENGAKFDKVNALNFAKKFLSSKVESNE